MFISFNLFLRVRWLELILSFRFSYFFHFSSPSQSSSAFCFSTFYITNFSAVEFHFFLPSCFLSFVFTARIVSVRVSSLLGIQWTIWFLPILTKEKWHRERKEDHGIKSLCFSLRKTSPFTCCSVFSSFILVCVVCISHCLVLLYRSNVSRDVFLSLLYCAGHRYLHVSLPPPTPTPPPPPTRSHTRWARVHMTSFLLRNFIKPGCHRDDKNRF